MVSALYQLWVSLFRGNQFAQIQNLKQYEGKQYERGQLLGTFSVL